MTKAAESIVKQIDEIREGMRNGGGVGFKHSKESREIFGADLRSNEDVTGFIECSFDSVESHGNTTDARFAAAINFMRMGYRAAMDELAGEGNDVRH